MTKESYYKLRAFKDNLAKYLIASGGLSVIFAVVLIFFYLVYVTLPIFESASVKKSNDYALSWNQEPVLAMDVEAYGEIGFLVTSSHLSFYKIADGALLEQISLEQEYGRIVHATSILAQPGVYVIAFESGDAMIIKRGFKLTYPDNKRQLTPKLEFPFGERTFSLVDGKAAVNSLTAQMTDNDFRIAIQTESNQVWFKKWLIEESFLDGSKTLEAEASVLVAEKNSDFMLMPPANDWLYLINQTGKLSFYEIKDSAAELIEVKSIGTQNESVVEAQLLLGGISLLVADSSGTITQYFPVRNEANQYSIQQARQFKIDKGDVTTLRPEARRKSFVAVTDQGQLGLYHATAHRSVLSENISEKGIKTLAIAAPGHRMVTVDQDNRFSVWDIDNEHPDISWSALWEKVWYESYSEPDYIWQSSSSSNDFESKFSLMPLAFGTLKAAFYAMLFAMPLAICGAIFTAYFMAPGMRKLVKPVIEIMEALPTVILGFLAGLWLAPLVEDELASIFLLMIALPVAIVGFGLLWGPLQQKISIHVPEGWEGALLIPVIIAVSALAFVVAPGIESLFFDGNMRQFISNDMGITYDQRNALVVGLAMGFAVIPTIFSITEDAIFSVPKHLSNGSLALGANRWQTMIRVVLPTASPGIFSAVMIGLGRAVGETMIVLMATGNTPIMDANIFEGMRTLSANIAVEMPESEVGSTHYRVLFLAALVLFGFTFVVNTFAEVIRQRLRNKYGSL